MRAEGKRTSQGMPSAFCYLQALYMEPIKVTEDKLLLFCLQRPGEKCGLMPTKTRNYRQNPPVLSMEPDRARMGGEKRSQPSAGGRIWRDWMRDYDNIFLRAWPRRRPREPESGHRKRVWAAECGSHSFASSDTGWRRSVRQE